MKKITGIASEDFAISPLMPLICLAKANKEGKPMSAQSESIVLEAVVEFGLNEVLIKTKKQDQKRKDGSGRSEESTHLSKIGWHLSRLLRRRLDQKDITLLYSLKEAMKVTVRDDDYLSDMLFFATRIFNLEMSREDYLAKAIIFDRIRILLNISEKYLKDYPLLMAAVIDITHEVPHFHVEKAKRALQKRIALESIKDNFDTELLTIEETSATISTEGIEIIFVDGIDFDAGKFITALACSFSLDKKEKERVLLVAPTLSLFQINELMTVFDEEAEKFQELSKDCPQDIYTLSIKQRIEWLELKRNLAKENTQPCAMSTNKQRSTMEAAV